MTYEADLFITTESQRRSMLLPHWRSSVLTFTQDQEEEEEEEEEEEGEEEAMKEET